jgi:hypothetical protein
VLSPGNTKLGRGRRIWSFSLPSRITCPGRSSVCERLCYSFRVEQHRPTVRDRYQRNLTLSRRPDFADRLTNFIAGRRIGVVRVHVGGDFSSPGYARQWLAVMRRSPQTRFYFYTRSWRVPAISRVLRRMATLANVRAWFSCDRGTGLPRRLPPGVRLAWLMTAPDDLPLRADLVFRVHRLRSEVRKWLPWQSGAGRALVCPTENGATGPRTACDRCAVCWKPLPSPTLSGRLPLPLVRTDGPRGVSAPES